jgi:hypothetical protein
MIYLGLGDEMQARKHLQEAMVGDAFYPGRNKAEKALKTVIGE